jgi:hypothetical protein
MRQGAENFKFAFVAVVANMALPFKSSLVLRTCSLINRVVFLIYATNNWPDPLYHA